MKPSQERSNREQISDKVTDYMKKLPEPKELPLTIEIKITYKEGTEHHKILL